jgi:two-component system, chemotaxis family, sensor kinase CheA
MSAGINMNEYIDLFLQEADEQLAILEGQIRDIGTDPSSDRIASIFRAAHTIKGSSRAMGFVNLADLMHEFENIMFKLRDGTLEISDAIADALINTVDILMTGREHIASSGEDMPKEPALVTQLQAYGNGGVVVDQENASDDSTGFCWDEGITDALAQLPDLSEVFEVTVELDDACAMKWVRVFMVINALTAMGEILATYPSQDELEAEQFESTVRFLFMSGDTSSLKGTIANIGEVVSVECSQYCAEPASNEQAEEKAVLISPTVPTAPVAVKEVSSKPPAGSPQTTTKNTANQTIRVNVSLLDTLMNLVGELVIDRTRLSQIGANIAAKSESIEHIEALAEATGHIGRITSELQEQIMRARMLPIDTVFQRFPRMIRELSKDLDKPVQVVIEGGETEVDRSVLEGISDPLIHMIRNSVDHGLETRDERVNVGKDVTGIVRLSACHKDNAICIEIQDDGRGINPDKLREKAVEKGLMSADAAARLTDRDAQMLIFHSGFSTAKQVSDLSGRGVGMDIVRSNIQALGGTIEIDSQVGVGTRFTLKLPLTVAIVRGLLARVSNVDYVMPIGSVIETHAAEGIQIKKVGKKEMTLLRGETVPIIRMRDQFKTAYREEDSLADNFVVVVASADQKIGLLVDRLLGEQEVVIKSIGSYCGDVKGISGATILGNGRVALITDTNHLVEVSRGTHDH